MSIQVRSNDAPVAEAVVQPEASKETPTSAPEANASEQNPSSESEAEGTEEKEETAEGELDADESESEESEADRPKKKGGFQRRIDKLNARHAAAQQEAEYWKQLALKNGAGAEQKDAPKEATKAQAPSAEGKPDPDRFETHAEYVEALTDWKLEQREKAAKQEQEKTRLQNEQATLMKAHAERVKSFAEQTEDFHEALEGVDDLPVSQAVSELIITSSNGPELMYELAKNRSEFERINSLPPLAAARELGRLESKLSSRSSEETKPEAKRITKAPHPIDPVGANRGKPTKSIFDPSLSQSDYEKMRRDQMKRRQG